jgi:hypothetical protein
MPREFYVDEGVNGMHLISIEQVPHRSNGKTSVQTSVKTSVSFKGRHFNDIVHDQILSSRKLFELLLRTIGHHDLRERLFSRAVIIDGAARGVMLYKAVLYQPWGKF